MGEVHYLITVRESRVVLENKASPRAGPTKTEFLGFDNVDFSIIDASFSG